MVRSHVLAALVGLLLGLVFSLFPGGDFPPYIILSVPLWGVVFYTVPTILGILLLKWLASRLGLYDAFAILAGIVALAVSFGLDYISSIDAWLTSRGEIHGGMSGGGPRPEDLGGHLVVLGSLAIWIGLMLLAALKWNRRGRGMWDGLDLNEKRAVNRYLAVDTIVISVVTFSILHYCLVQRREWVSPEQVVMRSVGVLNDPIASAGDRALALNTIGRSHDPRAIEILRREARAGTGEDQISAAFDLLGIDDELALGVLEKPLMDGGEVRGTMQATTSRTPSEGLFTRVAGVQTGRPSGIVIDKVTNPAVVPILVRLMGSASAETREGAASALRSILKLKRAGGRDRWNPDWPASVDLPSVTDAMVRALNDRDEQVRYFAVCTLMEANNEDHYPAFSLFQANEQTDLDKWKDWARANAPAR